METSSSLAVESSRASNTDDSSVSSRHFTVLASRALNARSLRGSTLVSSVRTEHHRKSTGGAVFTSLTGSLGCSRANISRRAASLDRPDSSSIRARSTGGAGFAISNLLSSIVGVVRADNTVNFSSELSSSAPASLSTQITSCTISGSGGEGSSKAKVTSEALNSLSRLAEVSRGTRSLDALGSGVASARIAPLAINAEGRSDGLSVAVVPVGARKGGCHALVRAIFGNRAGNADLQASTILVVAFIARDGGS